MATTTDVANMCRQWLRRHGYTLWWANETERDYRSDDGKSTRVKRSMFWHGRAWLTNWGVDVDKLDAGLVPYRNNRWQQHLEWAIGKRSFRKFGFRIGVGGGDADNDLHVSLHVPGASLYWGIEGLRRFKRRWDDEREISIGVNVGGEFGWGARWLFWMPTDTWRSTDPKYRRGHVDFLDALLGRPEYSELVLKTEHVDVPMPERAYPAVVTVEERTWRRKRWPFVTRRIGAEIRVEGGIPHPGKGENSWDCDDDATYSLSCNATTVPEAIGRMVASVMRDRLRYGGREWRPSEAA